MSKFNSQMLMKQLGTIGLYCLRILTTQYNTITIQHNYNTTQHNITQHNITQHNITQYNTTQHKNYIVS